MEMKKATKCLLGGALLILLLTPVSQVKADWHQDNVGWWYSLYRGHYYKNEEATHAVLDSEGWFHTGDLATMSADGHIFIRGRIKNMLLGSNGQNVYPEEIENKLNSMAMVNESLIVQHGDRLVGLVHPDMEEALSMGFTNKDLEEIMEQNRRELNAALPPFCKLSAIELREEEFEKTPKKSIKRYLYQHSYR